MPASEPGCAATAGQVIMGSASERPTGVPVHVKIDWFVDVGCWSAFLGAFFMFYDLWALIAFLGGCAMIGTYLIIKRVETRRG